MGKVLKNQLTKKRAILSYVFLQGWSFMASMMLQFVFSIILYRLDTSGVLSAYLEPASLLGIAVSGFWGGAFVNRFTNYQIGRYAPLLIVFILVGLYLFPFQNVLVLTFVMGSIACISSLEHSNGVAFLCQHLSVHARPTFFSNFQLLLQVFSIFSPFAARLIFEKYGYRFILITVMVIYGMKPLAWFFFQKLEMKAAPLRKKNYIWTGFREIIYSQGLFRITLFRMFSSLVQITYTTSLPIFIAGFSRGNDTHFAMMNANVQTLMNIGFIIAGILGSMVLHRKPFWVCYFLQGAPLLTLLASLIPYYILDARYMAFCAFGYGISLYLSKTANSIIAQALTRSHKTAQVILAGDSIVKIIGYCYSSCIPFFDGWMIPLTWILPGVTLGVLTMTKSIIAYYRRAIQDALESHKK